MIVQHVQHNRPVMTSAILKKSGLRSRRHPTQSPEVITLIAVGIGHYIK
jgi:hypothetical protein